MSDIADDKALIAAFEEGERAAAADAPRWVCNYAQGDDRHDAWQAGYDHECGPAYAAISRCIQMPPALPEHRNDE